MSLALTRALFLYNPFLHDNARGRRVWLTAHILWSLHCPVWSSWRQTSFLAMGGKWWGSFYQFSLLLFHLSLLPAPFWFFLLLPDNFSCSLLHIPFFCCSLLPYPNFVLPAPRLRFPCSLLPSLFQAMLLAPFGLKSHSPCSLITPNRSSLKLLITYRAPVMKNVWKSDKNTYPR